MHILRISSSETLSSESVEDLRYVDFKAFETITINILAKELDLKPNVLKRNCFSIHYLGEAAEQMRYKYCSNDWADKESAILGGLFGACCACGKKRTVGVPSDQAIRVERFPFFRHLREVREYLMKEEHLCAEGIFLKVGSRELQYELRQKMHSTKHLNLHESGYSVHDCANVLKQYLQQMADPLFSLAYYPAYERIAKLTQSYENDSTLRRLMANKLPDRLLPPDSELMLKEQKMIDCMQLIIHLLPQRKRELFSHLLDILEAVYTYRAHNRMNANTLGSIFAPLIMCPRALPRDVAYSASKDMAIIISTMIKKGRAEVIGAPNVLKEEVRRYMMTAKLEDRRNSIAPIVHRN